MLLARLLDMEKGEGTSKIAGECIWISYMDVMEIVLYHVYLNSHITIPCQ